MVQLDHLKCFSAVMLAACMLGSSYVHPILSCPENITLASCLHAACVWLIVC